MNNITKNIIIRNATLENIEIIIDFNLNLAAETENKSLNKQILAEGVRNILLDRNKGFYVLAILDNKIVGQLMITYEWSDWRNSYFWWIQSVYVLPQFRKSGIFKLLFKYIKDLAIEQNNVCGLRLYTDKDNINAMNAYKNLGMHQSNYLLFELEFNKNN